MLLGLDDFKQINNLKDHTFGDLVLRQMAQNIQQMLPSKTENFRFDGDEFAVVCPEASLEEIEDLYRPIYTYANCEHEIDGISYFCSVSGGISIIGKDADNYLDLLKFAASALDASKKRGKNTCIAFSPDLLQSELRLMELNRQLQHCVRDGMQGFTLVY